MIDYAHAQLTATVSSACTQYIRTYFRFRNVVVSGEFEQKWLCNIELDTTLPKTSKMASNSSETPETTDSPEDKLIAEIPEQEEDSSLLDSALGDVSVTEEQDNLLDDTADAVQIEDPVRRECGTADTPFEAHL